MGTGCLASILLCGEQLLCVNVAAISIRAEIRGSPEQHSTRLTPRFGVAALSQIQPYILYNIFRRGASNPPRHKSQQLVTYLQKITGEAIHRPAENGNTRLLILAAADKSVLQIGLRGTAQVL